jgi:hypothetical protein
MSSYVASQSSINKYEVNKLGKKIESAPKKPPSNLVELNEEKNKTVTSTLFHDTQAGITNGILGDCTGVFREGDNKIVGSITDNQNVGTAKILNIINGGSDPGKDPKNKNKTKEELKKDREKVIADLKKKGEEIIQSTVTKATHKVEELTTQLEGNLKTTLNKGLQSVMGSVTNQLGKGFLGGILGGYISELLKNCVEDINGRLELGLKELNLPIAKLLVSRGERLSTILSRAGLDMKNPKIDMGTIGNVGAMVDKQISKSSCWGNVGAATKLTSTEQDPYAYGNYKMEEKDPKPTIGAHIDTTLKGFDSKIRGKTNILGTLQNKEDMETSRSNSSRNLDLLHKNLHNFLEKQLEELSEKWDK